VEISVPRGANIAIHGPGEDRPVTDHNVCSIGYLRITASTRRWGPASVLFKLNRIGATHPVGTVAISGGRASREARGRAGVVGLFASRLTG
jgi:hypothetical protein